MITKIAICQLSAPAAPACPLLALSDWLACSPVAVGANNHQSQASGHSSSYSLGCIPRIITYRTIKRCFKLAAWPAGTIFKSVPLAQLGYEWQARMASMANTTTNR